MEEMIVDKNGFEIKTCGRCLGSGQYSYCQSYGSTCFGCKGSGKVYTKRSLAALAYGRELRTVSVSDVKVGWLIYIVPGPFGGKCGWLTVTAVSATTGSRYCKKNSDGSEEWFEYSMIETIAGQSYNFHDSITQAVPSKEFLVEVKKKMLEFQNTLNKSGKILKRKAKNNG